MDSAPDVKVPIEKAIAHCGGKQANLAGRLGCAQQTVSKLLTGEIPMTADWALKLSGAVERTIHPGEFYPPLRMISDAPSLASPDEPQNSELVSAS